MGMRDGTSRGAGQLWRLSLVVVTLLLGSCTTGSSRETSDGVITSNPPHGGTLRVGITTGTKRWDPQVNPDDNVLELERCCLGRTLLSYRAGTTAEGGTVLQPDLATSLPEVSNDGLTWTFHLKPGLHYGPPLQNVEITAQDFVRSLERLLDPKVTGPPADSYGPGLYRGVISGTTEYTGRPGHTTISGLEVPDPYTLRVTLEEANGDLGYLLGMPFLTPIPSDPANPDARYGILEGHNHDGSGYLVSSGPYMLEGSAQMDPAADVPASGYSTDGVSLVRNPSWDPATDPLRPAYADRIELIPVPEGAGAAWLRSGRVDLLFDQLASPEEALRARSTGRVAQVPADTVLFADLNVAIPPFDDPHVRRAVAAVIDRGAVAKVLAATEPSVPVYHIALDSQEENLLVNYVPSWASAPSSDAARLAAARAEMRLSPYDRNGDGRCDAPSCSGDLAFAPSSAFILHPEFHAAARLLAEQLRPLGLRLHVEVVGLSRYFARSLRAHVAVRLMSGFFKDYPGAATFLRSLYGSEGIRVSSTAGYNRTLVGASPQLLRRYDYPVTHVPSVDARLAECQSLTFETAARCWADVDRFVMEELVPEVPIVDTVATWVYGPRITRFTTDQAVPSPWPALDAIAVTT
jgi:peptide/nickel transport system substrate-binding protein